jgi:hypothetical protein
MRIVPSWDGTMFEALMVNLFVPEADWAPESWGVNHPLYVRAQREYGLKEARLGYWGVSASCDPAGGYEAYGIAGIRAREDLSDQGHGVVTPHASFLALPFAPTEALANLRALAAGFPAYGANGFRDSVNVRTGQVSERVLMLDQGMILAAIANALCDDVLKRGFATGAVEAVIRPLIAEERFEAGVEPREFPRLHVADPDELSATRPLTQSPQPLADAPIRRDVDPPAILAVPGLSESTKANAVGSLRRDRRSARRNGSSGRSSNPLKQP